MYFASIESISARRAAGYGSWTPHSSEDPDPAEHEDEVVGRERGAGEREQDEIRVAQVVRGGVDRAAERPGEAPKKTASTMS